MYLYYLLCDESLITYDRLFRMLCCQRCRTLRCGWWVSWWGSQLTLFVPGAFSRPPPPGKLQTLLVGFMLKMWILFVLHQICDLMIIQSNTCDRKILNSFVSFFPYTYFYTDLLFNPLQILLWKKKHDEK